MSEIGKSSMAHTQSIYIVYPMLQFVRAISSNKTYYFYMFIEHCVSCTIFVLLYVNVWAILLWKAKILKHRVSICLSVLWDKRELSYVLKCWKRFYNFYYFIDIAYWQKYSRREYNSSEEIFSLDKQVYHMKLQRDNMLAERW